VKEGTDRGGLQGAEVDAGVRAASEAGSVGGLKVKIMADAVGDAGAEVVERTGVGSTVNENIVSEGAAKGGSGGWAEEAAGPAGLELARPPKGRGGERAEAGLDVSGRRDGRDTMPVTSTKN